MITGHQARGDRARTPGLAALTRNPGLGPDRVSRHSLRPRPTLASPTRERAACFAHQVLFHRCHSWIRSRSQRSGLREALNGLSRERAGEMRGGLEKPVKCFLTCHLGNQFDIRGRTSTTIDRRLFSTRRTHRRSWSTGGTTASTCAKACGAGRVARTGALLADIVRSRSLLGI